MVSQEELLSLLKGILNTSPDLIFAKDASFTYIACNSAFGELIQKSTDDIVGFTDDELFNNKEQIARLRATDQKIISERKMIRIEEWATYPDGKRVLLDTLKTPLYDRDGNLIGLLGVCRDITDKLKSERALRAAKEKAETATAAKSDFLARMSHEIRTPMNAVIGLSHIILRTELTSQQKDYVEKIISSGESLLNLINDILDFSKIEAGKLILEETAFDLHELIHRAVNLNAMGAHSKGLELITCIDPNIPATLLGDPLRLQQVIVNLISNGIKFTDEGFVCLRVGIDETLTTHLMLKFTIKDTGMGMTIDQQQDLFESFQQVDDSITRKYGGTGLGLSIAKQLTELMEGSIGVTSAPNKGSEFYFTSKMKLANMLPLPCEPPVRDDLSHLRVLIVDDVECSQTALIKLLKHFNVDVEVATTGFDAIEKVRQSALDKKSYDILFIDWRMPNMDGIETSKYIHEVSVQPIPHIIMACAYDKDAAKFKAANNHINVHHFLEKPINHQALYRVLKDTFSAPKQKEKRTPLMNQFDNDLSGFRILLAEDDALNQLVTKTFLADSNAKIDLANDGFEAVEKLKQTSYDIVLMDIQMPNMDGLTATKIIREELALVNLPIIAMTAHAMEQDIKKSLHAGMNEHITKPITPKNLFNILNKYIR